MNRIALAAAGLLFGCQTLQDTPARMLGANPADHAELSRVLREILQRDVTLAPDALVNSSDLFIDKTPRRTLANPVSIGRVMTTPLRFSLVTRGRTCVLIDTRNQQRYPLEGIRCVAHAP
ncbi:MAG: hypothetical protein AB8G17_13990 [Gammaproteobacteria bacterium]